MKGMAKYFAGCLIKCSALIILSVTTALAWIYKLILVIYRLIAPPLVVIGAIFVIYDLFMNRISLESLYMVAFCMVVVGLYFVLPLIVPILDRINLDLEKCVRAPVRKNSPIRYVL